jgi:uncharacterized membrane protein YeaQ/YmgE (transglycosylase-associated protein family)
MDIWAATETWGHLLLEWIGFGTLVGLTAKAVMPGKDPGGPIITLLMGIGGVVIGCGILALIWPGAWGEEGATPLSVVGFVAGTVGGVLVLFFYRLLGGLIITEGFEGRVYRRRRRPTVQRSGWWGRTAAIMDDEQA